MADKESGKFVPLNEIVDVICTSPIHSDVEQDALLTLIREIPTVDVQEIMSVTDKDEDGELADKLAEVTTRYQALSEELATTRIHLRNLTTGRWREYLESLTLHQLLNLFDSLHDGNEDVENTISDKLKEEVSTEQTEARMVRHLAAIIFADNVDELDQFIEFKDSVMDRLCQQLLPLITKRDPWASNLRRQFFEALADEPVDGEELISGAILSESELVVAIMREFLGNTEGELSPDQEHELSRVTRMVMSRFRMITAVPQEQLTLDQVTS